MEKLFVLLGVVYGVMITVQILSGMLVRKQAN